MYIVYEEHIEQLEEKDELKKGHSFEEDKYYKAVEEEKDNGGDCKEQPVIFTVKMTKKK